jgi:hypothetical protein
MFNKRKKREQVQKANERLVRKVLQKDPGRRVFGFQCSPDIPASLKMLADQLHVPLFGVAEHALQLGAIQIKAAYDDPEEREELRRHLMEVHVGMRTIEKISKYDEKASQTLAIERTRRFAIEKNGNFIAAKYLKWGRNPELIEELIELGIRCKLAAEAGWSFPPEFSARPKKPIGK